MPEKKLARAKGRAQAANEEEKLAYQANGWNTDKTGATGAQRRAAEEKLVKKLGRRGADKAMRRVANKVVDSFK
ncbi:hypothetical protein ABZW11_17340 [Nonomuraea sp. NPDC004580]|uniref:hypothetical protein n=1 Tax=Nonomuraea sp. NPDC004580 TaxID=3154552 RepID=UPI0033AA4FF0